MIGRFGVVELVLILVIALVIFGPKKLPEIGKAIGQSIREFRSSTAAKDEQTERESQAEQARLAADNPAPGSDANARRDSESVEAESRDRPGSSNGG